MKKQLILGIALSLMVSGAAFAASINGVKAEKNVKSVLTKQQKKAEWDKLTIEEKAELKDMTVEEFNAAISEAKEKKAEWDKLTIEEKAELKDMTVEEYKAAISERK